MRGILTRVSQKPIKNLAASPEISRVLMPRFVTVSGFLCIDPVHAAEYHTCASRPRPNIPATSLSFAPE